MYLVDTNIVSELRKQKPHKGVLAWFADIAEESLYLSVVTLGEIQAGIEKTRSQDVQKALEIEGWLDSLANTYNVLAIDASIFRRSAHVMHERPDHCIEDALIAATALVRGLIVVTRNVRDFEPFGIQVLNPFGA